MEGHAEKGEGRWEQQEEQSASHCRHTWGMKGGGGVVCRGETVGMPHDGRFSTGEYRPGGSVSRLNNRCDRCEQREPAVGVLISRTDR